jgi:hypothetical protein
MLSGVVPASTGIAIEASLIAIAPPTASANRQPNFNVVFIGPLPDGSMDNA